VNPPPTSAESVECAGEFILRFRVARIDHRDAEVAEAAECLGLRQSTVRRFVNTALQ
jgi:hypothetical protein